MCLQPIERQVQDAAAAAGGRCGKCAGCLEKIAKAEALLAWWLAHAAAIEAELAQIRADIKISCDAIHARGKRCTYDKCDACKV